MKFDIQGRIENMDLPDGKTAVLYSVYEAVSNSIHAITDRFSSKNAAQKGRIAIKIELNDDREVSLISVKDNGIGFNDENIESFETSDSRYKYQRGGKGVGRFVWIKTFSDIRIVSTYEDRDVAKKISFDFQPENDNSIANIKHSSGNIDNIGTAITIQNPKSPQGGKMNQSTFMKDLTLHFFPLFVTEHLPSITLDYDGEVRNLHDYIKDKVISTEGQEIELVAAGEEWKLHVDHVYVDPTISTELRNSYLLTGHGRLVGDPVSIDQKFALRTLENGLAYVAVVSGQPLDKRVDQQRLNFRFNVEQREALQEAVLKCVEGYLDDHVKVVRKRQLKTVKGVLFEHPQLASQILDLNEYVSALSPGMNDEQIGQNLFVLLMREERDIRKRVAKLASEDALDDAKKLELEEALAALTEQEKNRLSELVVKRHQVLETANMLLKFSGEENDKYHMEKAIHDLICPMGRMYSSGDYDDHNLWILDESLSGYQFFASDKAIRSFAVGSDSSKEPDMVFVNPLGFRQPDTNAPVTIIEFKRPGDERPSKNPIDQVLEYIEELKSRSVRDVDGEIISDLTENTPFKCIVVCDLTEGTKKQLSRSVAQTPTPDGEGYYGWSKPHNATIVVLSFKKMLRDAYLRNKAFFDAVRFDNPSIGAKRRAANRRDKKRSKRVPEMAEN